MSDGPARGPASEPPAEGLAPRLARVVESFVFAASGEGETRLVRCTARAP